MASRVKGRQRTEALSVAEVGRAALALVDESGVEALSMRALGSRLGVEAMSLYHHVPGKQALLDEVAEALLAQLRLPPPNLDWEPWSVRLARDVVRLSSGHPNAAQLVAARLPRVPSGRALQNAAFAAFYRGGFSDELVHRAWHALLIHLRGVLIRTPFYPGLSTAKQVTERAREHDATRRQAPLIASCRPERGARFALSLLLSGLRVELQGGARHAADASRASLEVP